MLASREDVQKIIQEEQTANWSELCLSAIESELPEAHRAIAYAFFNRDEHGNNFPYQTATTEANQRHNQMIEQQLLRLTGLTSEERSAIFSVLTPRVATAVEAAWQLLGRLPYQTGRARKAFRISADNPIHGPQRVAWVRSTLLQLARFREKDLAWFAAWVPHVLPYNTQPFGILFAAAIDEGGAEGDEIFAILVDTTRNEHAVGMMGRHVTTGLLAAARQDGWDCMEHLLLAAQREEGLRQVILETVDEAHPEAFRRMLQLILEHDLLRFSATLRAADVWLGFDRAVEDIPTFRNALHALVRLLDERVERDEAIAHGNPQEVYFALWATAFTDAIEAIAAAQPVLHDPLPERRLAATHLLGQLQIPETRDTLFSLLADPDLRVAFHAFACMQRLDLAQHHDELFVRLQRLLERVSGKAYYTLQSGIWPWLEIPVQPDALLRMMLQCLGERDPRCMVAYLPQMNNEDRLELIKKFAPLPISDWDEEIRSTLYRLVGDRSSWVRAQAQELLTARPLDETSTRVLEQLLTRKGVELRRGLIGHLLKGEDEAVLQSASRLLAQRTAEQRLAGLDLLNGLVAEKRQIERAMAQASAYRERRDVLTVEEMALVNTILAAAQAQETPTHENVLGLISPEQRSPVIPPQRRAALIDTPAARDCLRSLDALIEEHRVTPVVIETWQGKEEMLLGNVQSYFPDPTMKLENEVDERENLPLAEVWLKWERERDAALRDPDGLELFRAALLLKGTLAVETVQVVRETSANPSFLDQGLDEDEEREPVSERETLALRYIDIVGALLIWLQRRQNVSGEITDFLLDAMETVFASIDVASIVAQETAETQYPWRSYELRSSLSGDGSHSLLQIYRFRHRSPWSNEHRRRYWQLLHWLDEPAPGLARQRPSLDVLMEAYQIGEANEADILDQLGGPVMQTYGTKHIDLSTLSTRVPPQQMADYPILSTLVADLRTRILEIELGRGELPTVATEMALSLRYSGGMAVFMHLIALLASPKTLVRRYTDDGQGKGATWSHLLRICYPDPGETPQEFAQLARDAHFATEQLVVAAVYAPQWAHHIEYTLNWSHFADAVWWIYAHTRGSNWGVNEEMRTMWQTQVAERTLISAEELQAGAVDVDWFQKSYVGLGAERWEKIYAAAKYAASGTGHGRARLYADAMSGKISMLELRQRVQEKRQQDAVRALGLAPLPVDDREREGEIVERYLVLQEFKRTGKKFGAQRRASEEAAIRIGLENLARTAGFSDPIRLQWAMETRTANDLRDGALTLLEEGIQITLKLDDRSAEPQITLVGNKGKTLNAMPAHLKKNENVIALLARKREIEQQIARMRISLEVAMCRGDHFSADEVLALLAHPVLARLLQNLIFVPAENGQGQQRNASGYPVRREGETGAQLFLRDHAGNETLVDLATTALRLAHPDDLFSRQEWHRWQHECFTVARAQPFKQVFREHYVRTSNEVRNGEDALSWRYAGQQVQPRQAHALLGQRGWVADYGSDAHRTFHAEKLTATVSFLRVFFTPNEVEGLTVERVFFMQQGDYKPVPLANVPPRVFSETMRDLDLMVSVAHSGGVDPEATASTVEMRSSLITETCMLLGLENVSLKSAHALIEGALGYYTVHIGSGVVHRQPGGALCIIPVHAQHRGRIFLPFADNDPKTAEVMSKVILLARDSEIKDPTILEQIL
ncbi:MAG TPA: DUF5724 domain-containing protein [Ktedonobacteraceae bacterium]|nr:DUF5724 domain-containing protein [Ktedonobacteraceae bacterium]